MAAEREAEIARLKANDPELLTVYWFQADVGNEEVARLAEALDGNTVLEMVDLDGNGRLTDVDRLLAAVGRSGVVRVDLRSTGGEKKRAGEKKREMKEVCAANAELLKAVPELTRCLRGCGLGQHIAAMRSNGITFETLPTLDDTTLAMVGLTADEMVVLRQVRPPAWCSRLRALCCARLTRALGVAASSASARGLCLLRLCLLRLCLLRLCLLGLSLLRLSQKRWLSLLWLSLSRNPMRMRRRKPSRPTPPSWRPCP